MPDWIDARRNMMLDPNVINLNSGSFGPTPKPVFDRITELRRHQAAEPMDFIVRATPPLLWTARLRLADFLGAAAERTLFTQNVSTAINLVGSGLAIDGPGDILMSDREYGSMQWCMERTARRLGLNVRTFHLPLMPTAPNEIIRVVENAITPSTRILFFSHVYSATGIVLPARELCSIARKNNVISIVDGAHAPAMIPLNLNDIDADFYAGNLHKWLLAPLGAGFLVLGRNQLDALEPLQVSWGYQKPSSELDRQDEFGSTPRLRALEFEGSRDVCPWLVVPDAIDFQDALGFEQVRSRIAELAQLSRELLDGKSGMRLTTPAIPALHGAMIAFWSPTTVPTTEVRDRLWANRIEALVNDWTDGRTIRISMHFYTLDSEITRFAEVLPGLVQ